MSEFDQMPFEGTEFVENPEPRCPCVLLLDVSYSMSDAPIAALNQALSQFEEELKGDAMAAKRVEVAVITFGGQMEIVQDFITADSFHAPDLAAQGNTPMGEAIVRGVQMIAQRKETYKGNGIGYYRPWMFLLTDGAPTDSVSEATRLVQAGEASSSFVFYGVGVGDQADLEALGRIGTRQPLRVKGLSFREMFVWLSNSLGSVSRSQPGDAVPLTNPAAPDGWASIE